MSWYRNSSGEIIVSADNEINPHNNISFQMGSVQLPDGSFRLIDDSLLYLCGKEIKKRRFYSRRSSEEVTMKLPFEKAIAFLKKDKDSKRSDCPQKHSMCRFFNEVFLVCSIAGKLEDMLKNNTPCSKSIVVKKRSEGL